MRYASLRDAGAAEELAMNSQSTGWRCVLASEEDGRIEGSRTEGKQKRRDGRRAWRNKQEQIPRVKWGLKSHAPPLFRLNERANQLSGWKDVFSVSVCGDGNLLVPLYRRCFVDMAI